MHKQSQGRRGTPQQGDDQDRDPGPRPERSFGNRFNEDLDRGRFAMDRDWGGYEGGVDQSWQGKSDGPRWQTQPGRGPKGYTRSDERIREDVCDRLSAGYLDASDVEVTVSNGEVTLSGTVANRQTKFQIEAITDHVSGIKDVHNRLTLSREQGKGTSDKPGSISH